MRWTRSATKAVMDGNDDEPRKRLRRNRQLVLDSSDEDSPPNPTDKSTSDPDELAIIEVTENQPLAKKKGEQTDVAESSKRCRKKGSDKSVTFAVEDDTGAQKKRKVDKASTRTCRDKNKDDGVILAADPGKLRKIKQGLKPQQKEDVFRMGFGGLLQMDLDANPLGMARWLIEAFDPDSMSVKRGDVVLFELTSADVHEAFGLPHCPDSPVIEDGNGNDEVRKLTRAWAKNYLISCRIAFQTKLTTLREVLFKLEEGGEDFKRLFVIYAISTFLAPVASCKADFRTLPSCLDVDSISKHDWCSFVLNKTVAATRRFKSGKDQQTYSGCYLLLLLTYMRKVHCIGHPPVRVRPFVKGCTLIQLHRRINFEKHSGGHGKSVVFEDTEEEAEITNRWIKYSIPKSHFTDREIDLIISNGYQQNIAKLIRDVNLVLGLRLTDVDSCEELREDNGLPSSFGEAATRIVSSIDRAIGILTETNSIIRTQFSANLNERVEEDDLQPSNKWSGPEPKFSSPVAFEESEQTPTHSISRSEPNDVPKGSGSDQSDTVLGDHHTQHTFSESRGFSHVELMQQEDLEGGFALQAKDTPMQPGIHKDTVSHHKQSVDENKLHSLESQEAPHQSPQSNFNDGHVYTTPETEREHVHNCSRFDYDLNVSARLDSVDPDPKPTMLFRI